MSTKIKQGDKSLVERQLAEILAAASLKSNQSFMTISSARSKSDIGFNAQKVQRPLFIVASCLNTPLDLGLRERENLVMEAAAELYKHGESGHEALLNRFDQAMTAWQDAPTSKYVIATALDTREIPDWLLPRRIFGTELRETTFDDLQALAPDDNLQDLLSLQGYGQSDQVSTFPFVRVEVEGRDEDEATEHASIILDTFRATLNWAYGLHHQRWGWGRPKPLAFHNASPGFVVITPEEGKAFPNWKDLHYERLAIEDTSREWIDFVLKELTDAPRPGDTADRLQRALLALMDGLDEEMPQYQFLKLWIALETLSGVASGATDEVVRRICNFWTAGTEDLKPLLDGLRPVRNNFVHAGKFDSQYIIPTHLLRTIVNQAITRFIKLSETFNTCPDLDTFIDTNTVPNAELERQVRVASERLRKRREG